MIQKKRKKNDYLITLKEAKALEKNTKALYKSSAKLFQKETRAEKQQAWYFKEKKKEYKAMKDKVQHKGLQGRKEEWKKKADNAKVQAYEKKYKKGATTKGAATGTTVKDKLKKGASKLADVAVDALSYGSTVTGMFAERYKKEEAEESKKLGEEREKYLDDRDKEQDDRIDKQYKRVKEFDENVTKFINNFNASLEHNTERIAQLGSIFQEMRTEVNQNFNNMKALITEIKDDLLQRLSRLIDKTMENFQHMSDSIKHQFLALAELDVHIQFTEEIVLEADLLERLMIQNMKFPTNETSAEFIQQYKTKSPQRIITELTNRLKYKSTNPIVAAMSLHTFKSKKIVDFWIDNINEIVYKLLKIEGFYYGLIEFEKNTSSSFFDATYAAIDELNYEVSNSNFKIDSEVYWPDLISLNVRGIMMNQTNRDVAADEIVELLNGIYTDDVFAIHVVQSSFLSNGADDDYLQYITGHGFYAMSTYSNSFETSPSSRVSQIRAYNKEKTLGVSVIRSESHLLRTKLDSLILNTLFLETMNQYKNISTRDIEKFDDFFYTLNEAMEGEIGAAVISKKPISERFTNEARSPLYWHNQVPANGAYVNVMWI